LNFHKKGIDRAEDVELLNKLEKIYSGGETFFLLEKKKKKNKTNNKAHEDEGRRGRN
jgi:peptidase E